MTEAHGEGEQTLGGDSCARPTFAAVDVLQDPPATELLLTDFKIVC
jgi:hypothetical protein